VAVRYSRFQIGCIIVEYDLFNATNFIQNLTYVLFGIILTQFYVNFLRQKHKIYVCKPIKRILTRNGRIVGVAPNG